MEYIEAKISENDAQDLKDQLATALNVRWTRVWLRVRVVCADLDQNFPLISPHNKTGNDMGSTSALDSTL